MKADGSPGRALRGVALAAMTALTVLTAACGKKGPPQPPVRIRPAAPGGLEVLQRGDIVWVSMRVPSKRTDGTALGEDSLIRLYLVPASWVPAGGLSPRRARGPSWIVPRERWADYQVGNRMEIPFPIESLVRGGGPPLAERGKEIAFVAEVQEGKRRRGKLAGPVGLALCSPPAPPASLSARMTEPGILLTWEPPGGDQVTARIYRGTDGQPPGDKPHATASAAGGTFLDRSVMDGKAYGYKLRFASGDDKSLCESTAAVSSARAQDVFPPAPPRGLAAAAEGEVIRLFWTPGTEPDLAGYLIYRRASADGSFLKLTEKPIMETTFADARVEPGVTYTYVVTAVDGATPPNESERSAPASERIR